MKIIPELMQECTNTIASHYAKKTKQQFPEATQEQIQQAAFNNWEKIQKEIVDLYQKTYKELQKVA